MVGALLKALKSVVNMALLKVKLKQEAAAYYGAYGFFTNFGDRKLSQTDGHLIWPRADILLSKSSKKINKCSINAQ